MLFLGLVLIWMFVWDLIWRVMGLGALCHGNRAFPQIALTFDDGPSELTEELLSCLNFHQVSSTFFISGEPSAKYPKLLKQLDDSIHLVAGHGLWHKPAFFLMPWNEHQQIAAHSSSYYRPPYGFHSLFTRILTKKQDKVVTLWDIEGRDWLDRRPDELATQLLALIQPGSVILLHDGPQNVPKLLEYLIPSLINSGYQFVRLDEMNITPNTFREGIIRAIHRYRWPLRTTQAPNRIGHSPQDLWIIDHNQRPPINAPWKELSSLALRLDWVRFSALNPSQAQRALEHSLNSLIQYSRQHLDHKVFWTPDAWVLERNLPCFQLYPLSWWQFWVFFYRIFLRWVYRLKGKPFSDIHFAWISSQELHNKT